MRAPYHADLEERAAVVEFDNGMSRAEAEKQAIEEVLERGPQPLPGILWELVDASRRRLHPDIDRELGALGLTGGRALVVDRHAVVCVGRGRPMAERADTGSRGRRLAAGGPEIEGVRTVMYSPSLAPRLYATTRRCWPVPFIAVPASEGLQHAA
jgi:hypothetical protein